ncbi:hypothetical protein ACPCF3_01550 [Enterococcus mundtii]
MSDYLTAEQYEHARKTGDWESGKALNYGQALNDNQEIFLLMLQKNANQGIHDLILEGFYANQEEVDIMEKLSERENYEVLAAFAQWGLEQEEAE